MNKPVIGLTLDYEETDTYAATPWYAIRENYCGAVSRAGGVPIVLPHETSSVEEYLRLIDGLIITGGNFDLNPALFGAVLKHSSVFLKEKRTEFELAIVRDSLEKDIPILGICGGEQLLNVIHGGTLIQHIPDQIKGSIEHEQIGPKSEPAHEINILEGTLLQKIVGSRSMSVNSSHHQAVLATKDPVIINAAAPDGVIEGIENPEKKFCLGIQWHPEFEINEGDRLIFSALIEASK